MNKYFTYFLISFLTFFIVMLGVEFIRWNNFQEMFYKEIQIASLDSMEITADEVLKQDGILYLTDIEETKIIIEKIIRENLGVSLINNSIINNQYINKVNITDFIVNQGKFHYEEKNGVIIPIQDKFPEVIVKGNFYLIPLIARVNDFYLPADINNRSEYIYTN